MPDDGISVEILASKFCNFFVEKITNIKNMLKDYISFVLEKKPGMIEFNQVSESYVGKAQ